MKHRRLNNNTDAGIATYILIMFGMSFILFLFGFTTMFDAYQASTIEGTDTDMAITDPSLNTGVHFIGILMSPIGALTTAGGIAALIGGFLIFRFMGASNVYYQFVIPAIILIALNIFVFPISDITTHTQGFNAFGFGASTFLLIFFNIFYILAAVEFIRGGNT